MENHGTPGKPIDAHGSPNERLWNLKNYRYGPWNTMEACFWSLSLQSLP